MKTELSLCELCGVRPGVMNSMYSFERLQSQRDEVGDWVCCECEQEIEQERYEEGLALYGKNPEHAL